MNAAFFLGLLGIVPFYTIMKLMGVDTDHAMIGLIAQFFFLGIGIGNCISIWSRRFT